MPCLTNLDRDEDGEPGLAEEAELERWADYLSELEPAEQQSAIRAKAIREFTERYDREHGGSEGSEDPTEEECEAAHWDAVDRAERKAERDFGC